MYRYDNVGDDRCHISKLLMERERGRVYGFTNFLNLHPRGPVLFIINAGALNHRDFDELGDHESHWDPLYDTSTCKYQCEFARSFVPGRTLFLRTCGPLGGGACS